MPRRAATLVRLLAVAGLMAVSVPALAQRHASELPPLTLEGPYPRASEPMIGSVGFPDHLHEYQWGGWTPDIGPDGLPVGPGSLCHGLQPVPRAGTGHRAGREEARPLGAAAQPGLCVTATCCRASSCWTGRRRACRRCWASRRTTRWSSPTRTRSPHYLELCGQGVWRLYHLDGNRAVIEPFAVLLARNLDGHGAFMLAIDWILRQSIGRALPPWLHQGLVEYLGDDGIHLADYMAEFRVKGPVVMGPAEIDAVLTAGIDPDQGRDREQFRKACYNAFLMTWQLVEYEGGMQALRDFLHQVAAGIPLDQAARSVYGQDLTALAASLDPLFMGEPAGGLVFNANPHRQP